MTSIDEDMWGAFGRRFYRFSGLTGDPNLNAATFLMALSVIYHQSIGRSKLALTVLGIAAVTIIAQSLSLTIIPLLVLALRQIVSA